MSASTLSLRRDPIRLLLSRATWSGAWYLFAYLFVGSGLFAIAAVSVTAGAGFAITLLGIPLLIAAASVLRWCSAVERARLRPFFGQVEGAYRPDDGQRPLARLSTRWHDGATWRDVAYLLGLYVPLFVLDTVVFAIWLTLLAGITLPAWYWAPWQSIHGTRYHGYQLGYFPNGPHGHPSWGLYVDTLPKAFAVAAASLILFLLFNYVLVATARLHANTARNLLGAQQDPLGEAKEVLRNPGPLRQFVKDGPAVLPNAPDSPPKGPSFPAGRV